jgi:hypothetical protein
MKSETKHAMLAWTGSIALHILLILPFLLDYTLASTTAEPEQSSDSLFVNQHVFIESLPDLNSDQARDLVPDIDQSQQQESNINTEQSASNTGPVESFPADDLFCADKSQVFLGVGVLYSRDDGMVTYAPEYYPAFRAGIRTGDLILNPDDQVDASGYITLKISRQGRSLIFRIKAEKICYTG